VSPPRNRQAFDRGQALRAEIRALLERHSPLARPLTARDILARLKGGALPSERTVQWHMQAIRASADKVALAAIHT
jgi:hypothetical protein